MTARNPNNDWALLLRELERSREESRRLHPDAYGYDDPVPAPASDSDLARLKETAEEFETRQNRREVARTREAKKKAPPSAPSRCRRR